MNRNDQPTDSKLQAELTSSQGREVLGRVGELVDASGALSIANQKRLQSVYGSKLVGAALDQHRLRRRAAVKFRGADHMFLTARGLEQATDEAIASYKASRFPGGRIADLCCGIGGDLIQLALANPKAAEDVVGVDLDPQLVVFARANLSAYKTSAAVVQADGVEFDIASCAAWHIDPDRRNQGRRTTHAAAFSPAWNDLIDLLTRNPNAAVKLASATASTSLDIPHFREWIGNARECRQQVLWCGQLAEAESQRNQDQSLTACESGERVRATLAEFATQPVSISGSPQALADSRSRIGSFLYDPHAVVLAANLLGELAARHSLYCIAPGAAYLTGDQPIQSPFLQGFKIEEQAPFDRRRWRRLLRERDIGRLEIKKRGVDLRPESIRKELKLRGDQSAVLILARQGEQVLGLLAQPLHNDSTSN